MNQEPHDDQWYYFDGIEAVDSPALVVYRDRVRENIRKAVATVGDVNRLRPHVKTHKTVEVTRMLLDAGVTRFKCATIAEAEMLALSGVKDILLAYQPVGPKIQRLISLIQNFPEATYSCLVDNLEVVKSLGSAANEAGISLGVYVDLNVGMNRTGIEPGREAIELYRVAATIKGLSPKGLHAYDGHIRNPDLRERRIECDAIFEPVLFMKRAITESGLNEPALIAGGSPTFPIHASRTDRECSPGTFVFWDMGYQNGFKEQQFAPAALVVARIISLPTPTTVCIDLGHKSIAAENILSNRVYFLNAPALEFIGQSEEHLVAKIKDGRVYRPGEVLFGLPYHICPTVALYERARVTENKKVVGEWKIIARDRKINI